MPVLGRIHSEQSFGASDGPGVRYVLFLQGCPLRCSCCHNPDTWCFEGGRQMSPQEVMEAVCRYTPFFGTRGGITVSGGEALMQQEFVTELFTLCRSQGIHTCLDTSGCCITAQTDALLEVTDLVLLDIKYTTDKDYLQYVGGGCSYGQVKQFLSLLQSKDVSVWLRQVTIPGKNDDMNNVRRLCNLAKNHSCVEKVELLPFKKLCIEKYQALNVDFPFQDIEEPAFDQMQELSRQLHKLLS